MESLSLTERLGRISRFTVFGIVAATSMVLYTVLAALPTDLSVQTLLVLCVYGCLIMAGRARQYEFGRIAFYALIALLSMRYFIWRTFNTIAYDDPLSFTLMMALYIAELFGFLLFFLSLFVNISPLHREDREIPLDEDNLPTVDVFIPTYNEDPELVSITITAAQQLDYPRDKLNVYILDDGGTDAKRETADPIAHKAIEERVRLLKNACERFGATYLTRTDNAHAKAGNVNAAFKQTSGDIILILDADHVPTADLLKRSIGLFQENEKIFLVQTPHFMINADPIERNLNTFRRMPSENEMFYRSVQKGLDFWDASFFCGSAALLRRKALAETEGFSTQTITEDAETAITLHSKGWKSAYLARPMVAGLAPETFSGMIVQRTRWAMGMVQILLLRNPLLMPGLTIPQRIGYLSSCLYWLFPIARFIFLLAPLAYLFFGLHIYNVSSAEFLVYTVPHFIASMIFSTSMFGNVRWPFIGAIYELMQSLYALPAVMGVFRNPKAPTFNVTPKAERLEKDFISPLSKPFYLVFFMIIIGFVMLAWRWVNYPGSHDVLIVTGLWNTINFISLLLALGTLVERKQLRLNPRMPTHIPCTLRLGGVRLDGHLSDMSIGGTKFEPDLSTALLDLELATEGILQIPERTGMRALTLTVRRIPSYKRSGTSHGVGLSFVVSSPHAFEDIVALVHGDSERWDHYWRHHSDQYYLFAAIRMLMREGILNSLAHARMLIAGGWYALSRKLRRLGEPSNTIGAHRQREGAE